MLAQLGWYAGLRAGASWTALFARAALWGLGAVLVQPLGLALGVGLLLAGLPGLAATWLLSGVWLATAAVGLAVIAARAAR